MKRIKSIKFEVKTKEGMYMSLDDMFRMAHHISMAYDCNVKFKHNGIKLVVSPSNKFSEILTKYMERQVEQGLTNNKNSV